MGVSHEMIIVEDRFKEMFDYLPTINGFEVVFGYGDNKELQAFLNSKQEEDSPYPLIWLVYPYIENQNRTNVSLDQITIILATDTGIPLLNKERLDSVYKTILIPLYNNVTNLFRMASIMNVSDTYQVIKFPKYSGSDDVNGDYDETVDVWDALKVTFDCTINNTCLRPIKFD